MLAYKCKERIQKAQKLENKVSGWCAAFFFFLLNLIREHAEDRSCDHIAPQTSLKTKGQRAFSLLARDKSVTTSLALWRHIFLPASFVCGPSLQDCAMGPGTALPVPLGGWYDNIFKRMQCPSKSLFSDWSNESDSFHLPITFCTAYIHPMCDKNAVNDLFLLKKNKHP